MSEFGTYGFEFRFRNLDSKSGFCASTTWNRTLGSSEPGPEALTDRSGLKNDAECSTNQSCRLILRPFHAGDGTKALDFGTEA